MRTMEQILEEIRSFPLAEQLRLVERVVHEMVSAAVENREVSPQREKISPVGWLADEPELADQLEKLTADARARGRVRGLGDETPR